MTFWTDFDAQLEEMSRFAVHTSTAQLTHRMALVEMWAPQIGDTVLEVGCGQADMTQVLAAAVGETGKVVAVDTADPDYGGPVTLGEAHASAKASPLGDRIDFRTSTDLLDPDIDFPEGTFDLAVFALSSWYVSSPDVLARLFKRARPWAKRLGFAEWDPRPQSADQLPHLLAVLVQMQIHAVWPESPEGNVRSLILPEQARSFTESAGWRIVWDKTTDISANLEDGRIWEISQAFSMGQELTQSGYPSIRTHARDTISAELQLLADLCDDDQADWLLKNDIGTKFLTGSRPRIDGPNTSLSTYVFLAE